MWVSIKPGLMMLPVAFTRVVLLGTSRSSEPSDKAAMVSPSISMDASLRTDRRSVVSLKEIIVAPS